MNPRVSLQENGIIRVNSTPLQPRAIVDENLASVRELIDQQKRAGKPVLLLIDLTKAQQVSFFARRACLTFFGLGVDRFALFGNLPHLSSLINCLAKLARYKHVRVTTTEADAVSYLLGKTPPKKATSKTSS